MKPVCGFPSFVIVVFLTVVSQTTFAQEQKHTPQTQTQANAEKPQKPLRGHKRPPRGKGRHFNPEAIIAQLNVNQEQKEKILLIMREQHQKRTELHRQMRDSRRFEHQRMKNLHQETMARLQQVLDPDTLSQFEQLLEQQRPPRPPHRGER